MSILDSCFMAKTVEEFTFSDVLRNLRKGDLDHNFNDERDLDFFMNAPENQAYLDNFTGSRGTIRAELLDDSVFQIQRRSYHWNLYLFADIAYADISPKAVQTFAMQLLSSPTLVLSHAQREALAYLSGVGGKTIQDKILPDFDYTKDAFLMQTTPLAFSKFSRPALTLQWMIRVCNPELIDQNSESLCGPTTLMQIIARNNPMAYVYYATELANKGKAPLTTDYAQLLEYFYSGACRKPALWVDLTEGSTYEAFKAIPPRTERERRSDDTNLIADSDYVTTASLRAYENKFMTTTNSITMYSKVFGVTFTHELERWMKNTGFQDVHTIYTGQSEEEQRAFISKVSSLISRGYDACFSTLGSFADRLLSGYDFCFAQNTEGLLSNQIYLELTNNCLAYKVINPQGNQVSGYLDTELIQEFHLSPPLDAQKLTTECKQKILESLTEKQHIKQTEVFAPNHFEYLFQGHYVHLRKIEIDNKDQNLVHVRIATWGKEVQRTLTLDELKGFFKGNSVQIGIASELYHAFKRLMRAHASQNTSSMGSNFTYLERVREALLKDWDEKLSLEEVLIVNNGVEQRKRIPKALAPLAPLVSKLRSSLSPLACENIAVQVRVAAMGIDGFTTFKRNVIAPLNKPSIRSCRHYLQSYLSDKKTDPDTRKNLVKNLASLSLLHEKNALWIEKKLDKLKEPTKSSLQTELKEELKQRFVSFFKKRMFDYRKELISEIRSKNFWTFRQKLDSDSLNKAIEDIAAGKQLYADYFKASPFFAEILQANIINQALYLPKEEQQKEHDWHFYRERNAQAFTILSQKSNVLLLKAAQENRSFQFFKSKKEDIYHGYAKFEKKLIQLKVASEPEQNLHFAIVKTLPETMEPHIIYLYMQDNTPQYAHLGKNNTLEQNPINQDALLDLKKVITEKIKKGITLHNKEALRLMEQIAELDKTVGLKI